MAVGDLRTSASPLWRAVCHPAFSVLFGAGVLLTALGPAVWSVLRDAAPYPVAVLAAAAGYGVWPAIGLKLTQRGRIQSACLAIALGTGVLAWLTVALGVAAVLNQLVAHLLLAGGGLLALIGAWWLRAHPAAAAAAPEPRLPRTVIGTAFLLPLAVPTSIAIFGACLPPGILWTEEVRGYDVLEYHLQVPREYLDAGRIRFLPHNVYASFPQQVEILYLLLMHLRGSALDAAIPAQLLHTLFGVLAVVALAAWAPPGWPRRTVALLAGSTPWLAYLGCLAYVELGMLFYAALAAALLLEAIRSNGPGQWRTVVAAGLCAGLAVGCKYTALAFVAAGLGVAWVCVARGGVATRLRPLALFGMGTLLTFSPWLLRNAAFSGNPVYPFAYHWFGGAAWSDEQAEQWDRGHRPPAEQTTPIARLRAAGALFGARKFGPVMFGLALVSLLATRSRSTTMLMLWSALILLGWLGLTHMPERFAVPLIVAACLLIGQGAATCSARADGAVERTGRWRLPVFVTVALLGALLNLTTLVGIFREHADWALQRGVPLGALLGATEIVRDQVVPLNRVLPDDARVWLVGEARAFYLKPQVHYTVVFNRDPWIEFARTATPWEAVDWLRTQNVSHLVFSWLEIERLRGSYGFPAWVTQDWVEALAGAGMRRVPPPPELPPGSLEILAIEQAGRPREPRADD